MNQNKYQQTSPLGILLTLCEPITDRSTDIFTDLIFNSVESNQYVSINNQNNIFIRLRGKQN